MATASLPDHYLQDRRAIADTLALLHARRRVTNGEVWLDHHCLFHPDDRTSASFCLDTGTYYCRTEDRTYPVPDVLAALDLPQAEAAPPALRRARRIIQRSHSPVHTNGHAPTDVYEYFWPQDGTLSHRKLRWGDGEGKVIKQEGPNHEQQLPSEIWPVYGDFGAELGQAWLVVEGEKAVDRITAARDNFRGVPICGITCGSANDLRRHARSLAARLSELEPGHLLLWPDNDDAGQRAMEAVAKVFRAMGLGFQMVQPGRYNLPLKAGADDYLDLGGSLADAFAEHFQTAQNGQIDGLVRRTPTTVSQFFVFPGVRRLTRITPEMTRALWLHETGQMPTTRITDELATRLRMKAMTEPSQVVCRLVQDADSFWWRPTADGKAWHVSAEGLSLDSDPRDVVIAMPSENPEYPVDVDESGDRSALVHLAKKFNLSETEIAMIEGWLVTAFCGLQTPVILMRSPAGTGKSTLARLVLAVLEPIVPHLDIRERGSADQRELVRTLERSPGLVLDNVSRMNSETEDLISKLVTGATISVRTLYEDSVTMLRMKRALIVTTTNWDVYKGDLASRIVVVQPSTPTAFRWQSDDDIVQEMGPYIPLIRGHIFKRCSEYYRQREQHRGKTVAFRVGSLGKVFAALGYDVDELARKESLAKSQVIAQNDPWIEALVEMWKEEDSTSVLKSTTEIVDYLEEYGCQDVPHPKSPKMARWLGEKGPIFRDYGFMVEQARTDQYRGYRFYRVGPGQGT